MNHPIMTNRLEALLDRENVLAHKCEELSKHPTRWSVTKDQIFEVTDELDRVRGRIKFHQNLQESGL